MDSRVLGTKQKIAASKLALDTAKNTHPINWDAVIKAEQELESYEDGLKRAEKLREELF